MNAQNPGFPPLVGLLAPSGVPNAWNVLAHSQSELTRFGVGLETREIAPRAAGNYARQAAGRGLRVLIVGSSDDGGALAATLAADTVLPVIRVPVMGGSEGGGENVAPPLALLWPEPPGPVNAAYATVAIGEAGARNAALLAVSILALTDERLQESWRGFRRAQTAAVLAATLPPVEP